MRAAICFGVALLMFWQVVLPAKAATVPFVGCPSHADGGPITPTGQPVNVDILASVAAKLALYVGVYNLSVLAPRGWVCSGDQSVGGNELMLYPPGGGLDKGPIIAVDTVVYTDGGTGGVVGMYARYFPKIISMKDAIGDAANWGETPDNYIIKRYGADKLTYLSSSTLTFTTPAGRVGLGSQLLPIRDHAPEPVPVTTFGLISIIFDDGMEAKTLAMRLPQSVSYLHSYIVNFEASCFLGKSDCVIDSDD